MNISSEMLALIFLAGVNLALVLYMVFTRSKFKVAQLNEMLQKYTTQNQDFLANAFKSSREESSKKFAENQTYTLEQMRLFGNHQNQWFQAFQNQMNHLSTEQSATLNSLKTEVQKSIVNLQNDNQVQLEKMRHTVDEKLQKTLETRLGHSFQLVSKHLEAVQKGLGEMQSLAAGVGDLKKVLSNVKTRGVMGEMMLGNILEQILTPDQYSLNVKTIPHSSAHVEFAIKFPGKNKQEIWLPIDSKFPMDIYEQLIHAYDEGSAADIDKAQSNLMKTVLNMAKDIKSKYIAPPHTTDFGILFLPIEGLFAEVVRQPGIMHELQSKYRIMIAGPTNLSAFLNSLQLGFRTLAIEERSSEVWNILASVKTEFGKFGDSLQKVQTKLQQASKSIDDVSVRSRAIHRNLRNVENLTIEPTDPIDLIEDLVE